MKAHSRKSEDMQAGEDRPSTEVTEKPQRRSFDAAYKLRILAEAERCNGRGELGELLRREGLYSSHLTKWRSQRDEGALSGLTPQRRGRKPVREDAATRELARLRRENERLQRQLKQAEAIIDVQKKVSEILGIVLPETPGENES